MATPHRILLPLSLLLLLTGCDSDGKQDSAGTDTASSTPGDHDGDGYSGDEDCNDDDADINPSETEICDGEDNDCDGEVDEGVTSTFYEDADGDGFGSDTTTEACDQPSGYVPNGNDCDDDEPEAYPGNIEVCDGIDNDCDSEVDEDVTTTWYADADGDGYGDADTTTEACDAPSGYVEDDTDCDDTSADAWPGNDEYCDSIDNDCDGEVDEDDAVDASTWYTDADGDGFGDMLTGETTCRQPFGTVSDGTDCDDDDADINPDAEEVCDGVDNDCDGDTDEDDATDATTWYADADGDGFGDADTSDVECDQPSGYVEDDTDCDDADADINPDADEVCDEVDNDCNGLVDDDPIDGGTWYADADADGFGDPDNDLFSCDEPTGYVENDYDCLDTDATEPVVVDASTGSSTGAGTASDPLNAISDGINAASSCVLVYPGTYSESIDFLGKDLQIRSTGGAEETTIDATGTGNAAVVVNTGESSDALLSGFTLTGGEGYLDSTTESWDCTSLTQCHNYYDVYCGGGVYVNNADPTLEDLVIKDNTLPDTSTTTSGDDTWYVYSYGGGLCLQGSNSSLTRVEVYSNHADQGGGLYASDSSSLTMLHGIVMENTATDGGGLHLDAAELEASNTIVACNEAEELGGGLYLVDSGAYADFENVVLYQDTSATGTSYGAGIYGDYSSTVALTNSIVYTAIAAYALYGAGSGSFNYNDVYNAYDSSMDFGGTYSAGASVIASDPLFTDATCDGDPTNDDFTLQGGSPAIDAGKPYSSYDDPDGSTNDLGAYGGPEGDW